MDIDNIDLSNPEAAMAAFEQLQSGQEVQPAAAPPAGDNGAQAAADAAAAAEAAATETKAKADEAAQQQQQDAKDPDPGPDPEGVATKDGKNVIPYSVLTGERARASRAEQRARDLQAQLDAIQAEAKPGAPASTVAAPTAASEAADTLSDEELAQLKEDFPTTYKAHMAARAASADVAARLKAIEESAQQTQQERERTVAEQVQDAIDSVPKLAHLQATDREAFGLATQFDAVLRQQADWADKPMAERFAKVVEMVEGVRGPVNVPGAKAPAPPAPPQKTAEELRQEALRKANAAAPAANAVPTSLSEFPPGHAAASDEAEALEQMSVQQLATKFGSMSQDQLERYFSTT